MAATRPWLAAVGALGALLLACGADQPEPPKPPTAAVALPNLPLPPNAEFVARSGGSDALQLTLRSPVPAEKVADYYRAVLRRGRWRLVADSKDAEGSVVLYAEQDGPPLWVRVSPADHGSGSVIQLTGAVVPANGLRDSLRRGDGG